VAGWRARSATGGRLATHYIGRVVFFPDYVNLYLPFMPPRRVKVAVIGSGLAGLTAAYLLSKTRTQGSDVEFDIHVFEKVSSTDTPGNVVNVAYF
jgi:hypothetical protein